MFVPDPVPLAPPLPVVKNPEVLPSRRLKDVSKPFMSQAIILLGDGNGGVGVQVKVLPSALQALTVIKGFNGAETSKNMA